MEMLVTDAVWYKEHDKTIITTMNHYNSALMAPCAPQIKATLNNIVAVRLNMDFTCV